MHPHNFIAPVPVGVLALQWVGASLCLTLGIGFILMGCGVPVNEYLDWFFLAKENVDGDLLPPQDLDAEVVPAEKPHGKTEVEKEKEKEKIN